MSQSYDLSKNGKLFSIDRLNRKTEVGKIEDRLFINTDQDNYHKDSKSLGIDKVILFAKDLLYDKISFEYHGRTLITTRYYFQEKSVERNILNGRVMHFLEIKDIYLSKALRYEKFIRDSALAQMDIFDVLTHPKNTNNQLLKAWEEAINQNIDGAYYNASTNTSSKQGERPS